MENRPLPESAEDPIDWELLLCTHVFRLPALHWGMWEPEEPLTLDGLRRAQERYSDLVLEFVPSVAARVLDVGCGTGDLALSLADRGHKVDAIAPIANYETYLNETHKDGISFHRTTFEEYETDSKYDLVMMVESAGYFDIRTGLEKARSLLKPGGYLLVVNPFRVQEVDYQVAKHVLSTYLGEVERAEFELVQTRDISKQVAPTLSYYCRFRDQHLIPGLEFARFALQSTRTGRFSWRIGSLVFGRQIQKLQARAQRYSEQLSPKLFEKYGRYVLMLMRATTKEAVPV